jgi:hypothetical protein
MFLNSKSPGKCKKHIDIDMPKDALEIKKNSIKVNLWNLPSASAFI